MTVKFASWNVNGLRAVAKKGFEDVFRDLDADVFAVQETKLQEGQSPLDFPDYHEYWSYAQKKGYSGTAVFSKKEPLNVFHGLGDSRFDCEGRVTTLEFDDLFFVCEYSPNSQNALARLDYRMAFEDAFREYLCGLASKKGVVSCGDMNVAHEPIDLARPKENVGNAGFSDEERAKFDELLDAGFNDTYRMLHPGKADVYTWWSYRLKARERNLGWRIDYFLVSDPLVPHVVSAGIHEDVYGSDHCPISLELDLDL